MRLRGDGPAAASRSPSHLPAESSASSQRTLCAARKPHATLILGPSALRVPSFAIEVGGGSLFAIGIGALPSCCRCCLQLGFGRARRSLGDADLRQRGRRLARRSRAADNATLWLPQGDDRQCADQPAFLLSYATFRPHTISSVILVLLLRWRLLPLAAQFTSTNTLAFSDVTTERGISRATRMYQHGTAGLGSMGLALGATLLHLTLLWRGHELVGAAEVLARLRRNRDDSAARYSSMTPGATRRGAEISGRALIARTAAKRAPTIS